MTTLSAERVRSGTTMPIRDVSLFVKVVGRGDPLLLMHGGPGADHTSMLPFRRLRTVHPGLLRPPRQWPFHGRPLVDDLGEPDGRCRRAAPAAGLREGWAVLGHSFGGHVALEYALRYPDRLSHLVLLDTGGDSHWAAERARALAERGYSPEKVELVRRWFSGEFAPRVVGRSSCGSAVRTRTTPACGRSSARCSAAVALQAAAGGADLLRPPPAPGLDGDGPPRRDHGADAGDGRAVRPCSRRSASASWRPGSPAPACGSSSAPATVRTWSSRPRSWRPSATSSLQASPCRPARLEGEGR